MLSSLFQVRPWQIQMHHLSYAILVILTLETSAMVLILRYSRLKGMSEGQYLSSTAVFLAEVIKLVICVVVLWYQKGYSYLRAQDVLRGEVWEKPQETFKLLIPSVLYTLQNNFLFYALTVLDATTYQVSYQLKILTTALFCAWMLDQVIRRQQWASLVFLLAGVALVQVQGPSSPVPICMTEPSSPSCLESVPSPLRSQIMGLLAVLASCIISGYCSVYYEQLVKQGAQPSVVIRNIQLGIFAVIFGAVGVVYNDWSALIQRGFFQGYNWLTWIVVIFQAVGGLTVAATIKYADNIQKSFATSLSIVLSAVCSNYFFQSPEPTWLFSMGVTLVVVSTVLYGYFSPTASGVNASANSSEQNSLINKVSVVDS